MFGSVASSCARPLRLGSVALALGFFCLACGPSHGIDDLDPGAANLAGANAGPTNQPTCEPLPDGTEQLVKGVRIFELAVFQGVKVSLVNQMMAVEPRNAEVIANRPALIRAYVAPEPGWVPRIVRARLTLQNTDAGGQVSEMVFPRTVSLNADSTDRDLDSTYNFEVPKEAITENTRYSLGFFETEACPPVSAGTVARLPAEGFSELRARRVGGIRVQLVPLRFTGAAEPLLPDTTDAQVNIYRDALFKSYPVDAVDVRIRSEPVDTSATTMTAVLDQLGELKAGENAPADLTYFGLVRFTERLEDYCSPSCVLGGAFDGDPNNPTAGVAVGVGYSGEASAGTFVHELGHVYGRPHTPCGVEGDPGYPYRGGLIGSWGYDLVNHELIDPMTHVDFMGYCSPVWVSDYTFAHLQAYLARLNGNR
ncbi:MAG: M66 family metalloprotease [Polyangiaceae bacterium]|nr:M66 family metalloprotease [Polyangiaceae bacterium]